MRGKAIGLPSLWGCLLGAAFLTVVKLPPMRLFIITLGSAEEPSSLTLFSPNIVALTRLFRRLPKPRLPEKEEVAEEVADAPKDAFGDDDELLIVRADDEFVLADALAVLEEEGRTGLLSGWRGFDMAPHNFRIRLL